MSTLKPQQTRKNSTYFRKNESLFDGTMGTWKTLLVNLDLKDGATIMCSRSYTVLRLHKSVFRKEAERLLKLGVLKEANES